MAVSREQVLAALAGVSSPSGKSLTDAQVLSEVVVTDGKVFFSLTVDSAAVKEWEPALALASGADGLEATSRLLREGQGVVVAGGWIALEVDCHRAAEVARLAAASGWLDPSVHRDPYGRDRYVLARRSETS